MNRGNRKVKGGPNPWGAAPDDRQNAADVDRQIAALSELSIRDLRVEWQRRYRAVPPHRLSRDLLTRGIAYKIQEQAHGGLRPDLKRRLRALGDQLAAGDEFPTTAAIALRSGARLVREWRGETHTVLVVDGGFEFDGRRFRSLSQVAWEITGAHWSGPRFFGLKRAAGKAGDEKPPTAIPVDVAAE